VTDYRDPNWRDVRLSWEQCFEVAVPGAKRRVHNLEATPADSKRIWTPDQWGADIEAAGAEKTVSVYTELPWNVPYSRDRSTLADVGDDLEVRHSYKGPSLIIYEKDPVDWIGVLVVGHMPLYTIRGWYPVGQVDMEWWREDVGKPAWFVPASVLRPIDELPFSAGQE
jgi:hypothetical protein